MKRILAFLLAAASLSSLAACSQPAAVRTDKYLLAAAQYPQMSQYPDESKFTKLNGDFDSDGFDQVYDAWRADRQKQLDQPEGYTDVLDGYLRTVIPQLLTDGSGENKACSPINIYMALAMLAEITDGESRDQILSLLGSDDLNDLRTEASAVWNANYSNDGAVTSILASSLWLNDKINFKQEAMDALAKYYYTSSFRGEMGSAALDQAHEAAGTLQFILCFNGKPIHFHRHIVNQTVAAHNGANDAAEIGIFIYLFAVVTRHTCWPLVCQGLTSGVLNGKIPHHRAIADIDETGTGIFNDDGFAVSVKDTYKGIVNRAKSSKAFER